MPLIGTVLQSDGILHLIVEFASGSEQTYRDMSADCLQFFNSVGNGLPAATLENGMKRFLPSVPGDETHLIKRSRFFA
jgi:hypothetical protein